MGRFLEAERQRQSQLRTSPTYFSTDARRPGDYKGAEREFCLPLALADENLFPGFRQEALELFKALDGNWHDGQQGHPSNHLCDSQVFCVNLLFAPRG